MNPLPGSSEVEGALVDAVEWIVALLLGSVGTALAVLAVASMGFLMLSGRLPKRRGAAIDIGCFIVFSAGEIASGLLATVSVESRGSAEALPSPEPVYTPSTAAPGSSEPYSGAAMPDSRGGDILE